MRRALVTLVCAAFVACTEDPAAVPAAATPASAPEPRYDDQGRELDPTSGLIRADGWELVAANCVACHSAQQFLRQRGTRQTWQNVIDWMQATQGLWQFPEGVEERIVDYLATHYGPGDEWRRAPIPASLMPPNPYASAIRAQVERLRSEGGLPSGPDGRR